MPITQDLIENGHVLLYTFTDPWQVNELTSLYPSANNHTKQVNFKVHSLADLRLAKALVPQGVLRARTGADFSHPGTGYVVVVGAFGLARQLAELVFRVANFQRVKFFDDMDEAMRFLRDAISSEMASNSKESLVESSSSQDSFSR